MSNMILTAVIVLGAIGLIFAAVLYFVAQKFKVVEDPLIDEIAEVLPGANCGGCGFAGCRAMAEAFVKQGSMDGLRCPAGGDAVAKKVADILGCAPAETEPKVAVVRCASCHNGTSDRIHYDGLRSCAYAHSLYDGATGCSFGCLGQGDCVAACQFGALSIDPETLSPIVDEDKCVGCGACEKACPRKVIELRNKGFKGRRVYVSCVNKEKGAAARKTCVTACIGCGKCEKTCPFGAIKLDNNLAYIDYNVCKACRKCVDVCPVGAIHAVNFPPKKEAPAPTPAEAAAPQAAAAETPVNQ